MTNFINFELNSLIYNDPRFILLTVSQRLIQRVGELLHFMCLKKCFFF